MVKANSGRDVLPFAFSILSHVPCLTSSQHILNFSRIPSRWYIATPQQKEVLWAYEGEFDNGMKHGKGIKSHSREVPFAYVGRCHKDI
jgi:hypothetical protein